MWMLLVAFWVILIWALYDGDLTPLEGLVFVGFWVVFLLGLLFLKQFAIWFIIPLVLLDIVLIFKVFGGNPTL